MSTHISVELFAERRHSQKCILCASNKKGADIGNIIGAWLTWDVNFGSILDSSRMRDVRLLPWSLSCTTFIGWVGDGTSAMEPERLEYPETCTNPVGAEIPTPLKSEALILVWCCVEVLDGLQRINSFLMNLEAFQWKPLVSQLIYENKLEK